jgi:2-hydroxychromene-2-carboxylate isomerase
MRETDGDACSHAVLAAATPETAGTITLALYRAGWSEAKSLATKDEICSVIAAAGVDPGPIAARIDASDVIAQLKTNTNEAAERGVFGSPTIFVGEIMFFGNDRLDFFREHLARQEQPA